MNGSPVMKRGVRRMRRLPFAFAALFALTRLGAPPPHLGAQRSSLLDVVIVGGRVVDPETNLDAVRTVGIKEGRIVVITTAAIPAARDTVQARAWPSAWTWPSKKKSLTVTHNDGTNDFF